MAGNARGLVLPTWTPTIDNAVLRIHLPFAWVATRFPFLINDGRIWVFAGTEVGVDYPALDQPDDGSYTGSGPVIDPYSFGHDPVSFEVSAGQPYTIVFTDSNANDNDPSDAPYTLDLSPLYAAMAVCGGVDNPPLPPEDDNPFALAVTDGKLVLTYLGMVITSLQPGAGISIDDTDPRNPLISATGGGSGEVASVTGNLVDNTDPANPVVAGVASVTGTSVDNTDPANPVVAGVASVTGTSVDNTDPANPVVGAAGGASEWAFFDLDEFQNFDADTPQMITWRQVGARAIGGARTITVDPDDHTMFKLADAGLYLIRVRYDLQPAHGATRVELLPVTTGGQNIADLDKDFFITQFPLQEDVDDNPIAIWTCYASGDASFQIQATLTGNTSPEEIGDSTVTIIRLSGAMT